MAQAVILISSYQSDTTQEQNQRRLEHTMQANKIDYLSVDGALAENKETRDTLFSVSGQRGKYPQCFIKENDTYTFIGLWDAIESLLECNDLPAEVLEANPNIPTFEKTFANV
eukprot:CAMPEP_0185020848 /NCGR_PEP_ID=MMETSP1103-20130426/3499_1 /TAXON_ID=36769 /ORGANISM="Paraphysomonas bandaiensis, Strain Caron Lab Isolate" /LENGTH=112 /DNA_ID=CAMNT_0027552009 /DNA_START=98 /DNA_END=432 /DNA_ORIENTATION=-